MTNPESHEPLRAQPVITKAEIPLPVEPLWTLESAAILLVVSVGYLKRLLRTHRAALSAPRYQGSPGRRRRLLTGAEIQYLRSVLVSTQFRIPSRKCLGAGNQFLQP
jgi:hypothetical protein